MYIYNICKYVWIWSEFQRGDKIKSKWEHQLHDTSHIRVQMHKATNKVRCIRYVSIFSTVLSGNDTARFFFLALGFSPSIPQNFSFGIRFFFFCTSTSGDMICFMAPRLNTYPPPPQKPPLLLQRWVPHPGIPVRPRHHDATLPESLTLVPENRPSEKLIVQPLIFHG